MNTILSYLAMSALTTAAATAIAMGDATLELAIARAGSLLGGQKGDSNNPLHSVHAASADASSRAGPRTAQSFREAGHP